MLAYLDGPYLELLYTLNSGWSSVVNATCQSTRRLSTIDVVESAPAVEPANRGPKEPVIAQAIEFGYSSVHSSI